MFEYSKKILEINETNTQVSTCKVKTQVAQPHMQRQLLNILC